MPSFNLSQAFPLYTQFLADVYKEKVQPTSYLRSYFPNKVEGTKLLSIMVQRAFEQVAIDCYRGDEGHRNQWTQSSQKIFEPLYFRENFDLTSLQLYDALFQPGGPDARLIMQLLENIIDNQLEQQGKIERAIEIMCAQVLETGVIQMSTNGTGISVDYKRKALSMYDPGVYWDGAADPFTQIARQCKFIRTVGKAQTKVFDVIMGEDAAIAFLDNTKVKARQNLFNYKPDQLIMPVAQDESVGHVLHGQFTAGDFRCNMITYPSTYDVVSGSTATPTSYLNAKKVTILPSNNDRKFFTYFGAIPQVVTPGAKPMVGDFVNWDWITPDKKAHLFEVESAPLPVPVKVDQIANIQALA